MITTAKELAAACVDVAKNHKTLYVMGCFGAPMNEKNKKRYCNNHAYNKKPERTAMVQAASADTFGFDCVNLIKGLMWGWSGDTSKTYGGATYKSNDVPDKSANGMIKLCNNVSTDFSKIKLGAAVWMDGHIGVYIGDGLAVECTPKWKNCVQITAVHNIGKKAGYNGRTWTKHGELPFVVYETAAETKPAETCNVSLPVLAKGSTGEAVKTLQIMLNAKLGSKLEKPLTIDGDFGKNTDNAFLEYQRTHKDESGKALATDGSCGPKSWGSLLKV